MLQLCRNPLSDVAFLGRHPAAKRDPPPHAAIVMRLESCLLLATLFLLISGCSPTGRSVTTPSSPHDIPPPGTPWSRQAEFGYTDVYAVVDEMPTLERGLASLQGALRAHLELTPCARTKRLLLIAVVDRQGKVEAVHIPEPTGEACEAVGKDVVKRYTFTPGRLDGEPVKVVLTIPVQFR